MVKTWSIPRLLALAAVLLLPVGGAEGQTGPDTTPPVITLNRFRRDWGERLARGQHHCRLDAYRTLRAESESSPGCGTDGQRRDCGNGLQVLGNKRRGNEARSHVPVKLDKTPPTVRPRPTRPADRNGWFNHRVHFEVIATDAISGVDRDTCTPVPSYGDPDKANVRIRASCRDMAGHRDTGTFLLDYDDTAPQRTGGPRTRARPVRLVRQGRARLLRRERRGLPRGRLLVQGLPGPGHGARLRHRLVPGPRGKPTQPHAHVQVLQAPPPAEIGQPRHLGAPARLGGREASARVQRPGLARRAQDPQQVAQQLEAAARPRLAIPGTVAPPAGGRALQGVRVAALPEGLRGPAQPGRLHLRRGLERELRR